MKGELTSPIEASQFRSRSSDLPVGSAEPDNTRIQSCAADARCSRAETASEPVHFPTGTRGPARDHFGDSASGFSQTHSERRAYASGSHDRDLRLGHKRPSYGGEDIRTDVLKRSPLYWFHGTIVWKKSSNPLL